MIALRLIRVIEDHSDAIAQTLAHKLRVGSHIKGMPESAEAELVACTRDLLRHLSDWLLTRRNNEIELRYRTLGVRLAEQHVSFAHCCWAMAQIKQCLCDFLNGEGFLPNPIELYGELELLSLLNQFFDHAVCYLIEGRESGRNAERLGVSAAG